MLWRNTGINSMQLICHAEICSELNGQPDYLDIVGVNHYYNSQWVVNTSNFLGWKMNLKMKDGVRRIIL
jgi:hypothetical protein